MRKSKADSIPKNDSTDGLADLVARTLRHVCAGERPVELRTPDLRLLLRDTCRRACDDGLRVEQLIVVLKQAWRELPERRRLTRVDADAALAQVVTACIDEYYQSSGTGRELPVRLEAAHLRNDSPVARGGL